MTVATPALNSAPVALPPLTPARLFSTPLAELLAELDVETFRTSISDPSFYGALVKGTNGRITLALPQSDRGDSEDTVARALLGQVFDVPMAPLPDSLEISEVEA